MRCEICKKEFIDLQPHLKKHKISGEEYKERFGVESLFSEKTLNRIGEEASTRMKNGQAKQMINKYWKTASLKEREEKYKKAAKTLAQTWKERPWKVGHWNKGKKHTEDFKEMQRRLSKERFEKRPDLKEKFLSYRFPLFGSGSENPKWIEDRHRVRGDYTIRFWDMDYRQSILEKQNNICPVCDSLLTDDKCLHHIDYEKWNDKKSNMAFVHRSCHGIIHSKEDYWREKLGGKIS